MCNKIVNILGYFWDLATNQKKMATKVLCIHPLQFVIIAIF